MTIGSPHGSIEPAMLNLHGVLIDEETVAKSGNRTIEIELLPTIVVARRCGQHFCQDDGIGHGLRRSPVRAAGPLIAITSG